MENLKRKLMLIQEEKIFLKKALASNLYNDNAKARAMLFVRYFRAVDEIKRLKGEINAKNRHTSRTTF